MTSARSYWRGISRAGMRDRPKCIRRYSVRDGRTHLDRRVYVRSRPNRIVGRPPVHGPQCRRVPFRRKLYPVLAVTRFAASPTALSGPRQFAHGHFGARLPRCHRSASFADCGRCRTGWVCVRSLRGRRPSSASSPQGDTGGAGRARRPGHAPCLGRGRGRRPLRFSPRGNP